MRSSETKLAFCSIIHHFYRDVKVALCITLQRVDGVTLIVRLNNLHKTTDIMTFYMPFEMCCILRLSYERKTCAKNNR